MLSDPTTVNPTFVADVGGDYVLELTVDDGRGGTDIDQVAISVWKCVATNYDPKTHGFAFENYPYDVILIPWLPDFYFQIPDLFHCLGMASTSYALHKADKHLPTPGVEDPPGYVCNPVDGPPPWNALAVMPGFGFPP